MTIDEAIKRFIDNAEYERSHGSLQGCLEFRQLAEWLAELKHLREQTEPCEDRKNCPLRHENGNCLSVGGFCLAVDDKHCQLKKEPCGKDINVPATDAISRQAAIEQSIVLMDISNPDKEWEVVTVGTIKHLKSVHPEQKWIPVSERLPESDCETVLVSGKMKYASEKEYEYFVDCAFVESIHGTPDNFNPFDFETWNDWYEGQDEYYILAWMSLPEPYKVESEDT